VLFKERMTKRQVACFTGSTIGLILVINVGGFGGGTHMKGVAFGLAAAVLYATVVLMNKRIRRVSGIDRTLMQFAAAALVLLPYVLMTTGIRFDGMTPLGWACLLCVGVLHSGVAYVLYFSALRTLPGQEAAILSYIDPLVAVVISLTVLGEPVTGLQLLGGAMILAFTLINEL
jgi:drug/metabolite transporter (DMT)-like permease